VDEFKVMGENTQPLSRLETLQEQCMGGSGCLAEERDEQPDSNAQLGHKYYIKSLIRVEDELNGASDNKYRSIKDIVSNSSNEIESNENDLFYLLNN
jgi:hypothetical protein